MSKDHPTKFDEDLDEARTGPGSLERFWELVLARHRTRRAQKKVQPLSTQVFNLLRRGKLDVSQISAELGAPADEVLEAIDELQQRGVVAERPDRGMPQDLPPELHVYGIHFSRRPKG